MPEVIILSLAFLVTYAILKDFLLSGIISLALVWLFPRIGDLWPSHPIGRVALLVGGAVVLWFGWRVWKAHCARRRPTSEWMLLSKKEKSRIYKCRGK